MKPPRFNPPLTTRSRGAETNLQDTLSMLGCFADKGEVETAAKDPRDQVDAPSP